MSYELTGKIHVVMDTQKVSEKFQKREFVVHTEKVMPTWTKEDHIKFQLTQDRCDILDGFSAGEEVKVSFNLTGRPWTNKEGVTAYFTNLEAWRIERMSAAANMPPPATAQTQQPMQTAAATTQAPADDFNDDLPF